ncbi:embryonic polarity protein dorsal-like [Copidosoma floridanum]|uniref:embryonic polarity protein dorsal-like n=1 Tax=Copidosoma floridanum TaxID=29053 RepID=UPI000C6F5DC2|nr:embryonic polarity protein dorsal-like [Copidosoma floridanum]
MADLAVVGNGDKVLNEILDEVVEIDPKNGNALKTEQYHGDFQVWDCPEDLPDPETVVLSPIISIVGEVPPPRPPPPATRVKRDVLSSEVEGPVPPLPPKRIRKTPSMPTLVRAPSQQTLGTEKQQQSKALPTLPGMSGSPKPSKPSLFSKLFSRRAKPREDRRSSTASLPEATSGAPPAAECGGLDVDGDATPPYGADLTEAENYALYMAMAPHATASEFDEMSFYYSPVEGGKILESKDGT